MPPSDPGARARPPLDWRGWLALAWVLVFGLLYARATVEHRGGKVRAALSRLSAVLAPPHPHGPGATNGNP